MSHGTNRMIAWIRDRLIGLTEKETEAYRDTGKGAVRSVVRGIDESSDVDQRGRQDIEKADEGLRTPEHGGSPLEDGPPPPRLVDRSVPGERYFVQDTANPRFVAHGSVSSRGELSIDLRTQLEDGQRSTRLRGAEHFQAILKFFEGEFTSIKANWQYGTNLARLNELTARGLPLEAAAARTWTGEQAGIAGFRTLRILNSQGDPGRYTTVKVEFTQ
ncbi:hypothetical protein NLM24_07805 [Nocardia zapadnayensis]|uniref:hypothetical protein n=1 Tax=Nocardia rhamnosiphila TaxID=426716 RepID=UPI0022468A4D|nr:hypothetical protein [Nocardia zapadnayensis]MCX0270609.1 hypothetical protein [Nocardia zapadnayensis]